MKELAKLIRAGWIIQIAYQSDGFYVDANREYERWLGYSPYNLTEAVRNLLETMKSGLSNKAVLQEPK